MSRKSPCRDASHCLFERQLPAIIDVLDDCVRLLADYDNSPGDEGRVYRRAVQLLSKLTVSG